MPVLPELESRITLSRVSAPDRSPSSIMRKAGRSFTDPPGLNHSALPYTSTWSNSLAILAKRSRGVLPICSRIELTDARVRRLACLPVTLIISLRGCKAAAEHASILRQGMIHPISPGEDPPFEVLDLLKPRLFEDLVGL